MWCRWVVVSAVLAGVVVAGEDGASEVAVAWGGCAGWSASLPCHVVVPFVVVPLGVGYLRRRVKPRALSSGLSRLSA